MQEYGIGLLGWGTVGGGVLEILANEASTLQARSGFDFKLRRIVTRDPARQRAQDPMGAALSKDCADLVNDDSIQCVLHLVGGTDIAKDMAIDCLKAGKHVVTANKALLAEHWDELHEAATAGNACLAYEAAVAGGIPTILNLRDGLVANRITGVKGILNGTCNYILTQMEERGLSYDDALSQAQELGYAEADPTLDVDGTDTAHKLAILARIAYQAKIDFADVAVEGIQNISATDIASAKRMGARIKLLGVADMQDNGLELHVAPTLVPIEHELAAVRMNYNAVLIDGHAAGSNLQVGQGAGALPTASAIVADLVSIASGSYAHMSTHGGFISQAKAIELLSEADEQTGSYGRFHVKDEPGVLAAITNTLSDFGINILSVNQEVDSKSNSATVEVITHPSRTGDFLKAIESIDNMGQTVEPTVILRRMFEK